MANEKTTRNLMRSEKIVDTIMKELYRLGLAYNPDMPMFEKTIRRLAEEFYELVDEGEFEEAYTAMSRIETTAITFVNALWLHKHISFTVASVLKKRFSSYANLYRLDVRSRSLEMKNEYAEDYNIDNE